MFGRRCDGRRLDHIDPIVRFMPYIMPARNDAMNLVTASVDYEPLAEYIKKRSKEGSKISFMSLIVAAYVRTVAEYPALNRFIMNRQVFARNQITVSLTVLRNANDKKNNDEALVKMHFSPDATLDEVNDEINRLVRDAVNEDADNSVVNAANILLKLPLLARAAVGLVRVLDRYGILPKFVVDLSPFHCSMFITNMASIGMPSINHHLYNFGNTTVFIAMGKAERRVVPTRDGTATRTALPLGITTDERICGGAAYAQGIAYLQQLLAKPELLETRPDHVNSDF